jgi:hypothetical protein
VSVATNGPPIGGSFSVSPLSGVALTTYFTLAAADWFDEDLPLTYQFLFLSTTGSPLELRQPLIMTTASVLLPSGISAANNTIQCLVHVYDAYLSYTSNQSFVVVHSPTESTYFDILAQLQGSSDGTAQEATVTVNLVSEVMNQNICSSSQPCSQEALSSRISLREWMLETISTVAVNGITNSVDLTTVVSSLFAAAKASSELSEASTASVFSVSRTLLQVATTMSGAVITTATALNIYAALNSATLGASSFQPTSSDAAFSVVELAGACNALLYRNLGVGATPNTREY